jgi:hypothetical protein
MDGLGLGRHASEDYKPGGGSGVKHGHSIERFCYPRYYPDDMFAKLIFAKQLIL